MSGILDFLCKAVPFAYRYIAVALFAAFLAFGCKAQDCQAQSGTKELDQQQQKGKIELPATVTLARSPSVAASTSADPSATLRSARLIYVRSSSLLVRQSVIEDKLRQRSEFKSMGLMITRDLDAAELILELKHDLFTMYVYTAIDPKTKVVVASGKLSSLGGTVAGKVAKRFLRDVLRARQS